MRRAVLLLSVGLTALFAGVASAETPTPHNLILFVPDGLGPCRRGRLHREIADNLQQVVLHHVAHNAKAVKVAAAALGAKVLLERDLHVLDAQPRPHGLKDEVGKAQRQMVVGREERRSS